MARNWYNQIPYAALKTKREITKYMNWQQFTKGTRGKPNEQQIPHPVQDTKWESKTNTMDGIKYKTAQQKANRRALQHSFIPADGKFLAIRLY